MLCFCFHVLEVFSNFSSLKKVQLTNLGEHLQHKILKELWLRYIVFKENYQMHIVSLFFYFYFYLFMIVTQRERGRDIGRGRSRLHAPGARRGTRSRVSRIAPWAKGRRQTAAPPRDPKGRISEGSFEHMIKKPLF